MAVGRIIKPGQKVHVSVCFMDPAVYKPKATFDPEMANGISWDQIVGVGRIDDGSWADDPKIEKFIEKDIFDISWVPRLIQEGLAEPEKDDWFSFLVPLTLTRMSFLLIHKTICLTFCKVRVPRQSCVKGQPPNCFGRQWR